VLIAITRASTLVAIVLTATIGVSTDAKPSPKTTLSEFASGLASPTDIATAGDTRLFVTEQAGVIKIVEGNGAVSGTFLDISDRVLSGGEQGLLGLAFAPDYTSTGRFFVYYTRDDGNNQVSSFAREDDDHADASSETPLLTLSHPGFSNHNGGDLNFGSDGYLYVATGDGGGGGDPDNNAQNIESLLGKILRLDVGGDDFPGDSARNYANPGTNPFVGKAGADEVWVLGLRNPWRFSFDSATDNMFIGDVGQGSREEIDFQQAGSPGGENYGWSCHEGSLVFNFSSCSEETAFVFPVAEYENEGARCAVTGGYVYRGRQQPQLRGDYYFIDFCSGELSSFRAHAHKGRVGPQRLLGTFSDLRISSFGQASDGEIYAADLMSGKIYHLQGR